MKTETENNVTELTQTAAVTMSVPAAGGAACNLVEAQPKAEVNATTRPESEQTIQLFTKLEFDRQKLKCPSVSIFCDGSLTEHVNDEYASQMTRLLGRFEGGKEIAQGVCSQLVGFDQTQFDADILAGRTLGQPELTCAQIKMSGCASCPLGGCTLPTGEIAINPLELQTWSGNPDKVGPRILAKSVIEVEFGGQVYILNDIVYVPENGVYITVSEDEITRKILNHVSSNVKASKLAEILKLIKAQATPLNRSIRPNPNLICFKNGIFNVETRTLAPHSTDHLTFNGIPHVYIADATCGGFLAFLESIWGRDRDYAQKVQLIRQWIGYSLVSDSSLQRMLILTGQGANGKSVLIDLMRDVVGEENAANAMLDRFHMPYVRATLENKLVNFSADLPKKKLTADGDLKAIVGGDLIEVALKHKPSRSIRPYARLVVSTNNIPDCHDTSDGYFRRLIILPFTRKFAGNEINPHLYKSLVPEIPGIIAWALGGLYELREQGHFTIPDSSEQAVQLYREELSPVRMFAEECLVKSSDRSGMLPNELFMAFKGWCSERGFPAGNMIALGRELGNLGYGQRKSGRTWWLVNATEIGEQYFLPAQVIPSMPADEQTVLEQSISTDEPIDVEESMEMAA
ncbi:putative DNA primase/helicase [Oxalobacteraceae bacterium GrIS 1.18]